VKHPRLSRVRGTYINDLGLLYVNFHAAGTGFARAICLSHLEPPFRPLGELLLQGWGVDSRGRPSEAKKI
jgi:hypothetical protein